MFNSFCAMNIQPTVLDIFLKAPPRTASPAKAGQSCWGSSWLLVTEPSLAPGTWIWFLEYKYWQNHHNLDLDCYWGIPRLLSGCFFDPTVHDDDITDSGYLGTELRVRADILLGKWSAKVSRDLILSVLSHNLVTIVPLFQECGLSLVTWILKKPSHWQ